MKEIEILPVQDLIYIAKHIGLQGVYKLGVTRCLRSRVSSLNGASPYGIEVVAVEYSERPRIIEDSLLEKWKHNRVNGEWFELNENEIELLKSDMKLIAEIISAASFENAREAVREAGYSVSNHGNYKYEKISDIKIVWKKPALR